MTNVESAPRGEHQEPTAQTDLKELKSMAATPELIEEVDRSVDERRVEAEQRRIESLARVVEGIQSGVIKNGPRTERNIQFEAEASSALKTYKETGDGKPLVDVFKRYRAGEESGNNNVKEKINIPERTRPTREEILAQNEAQIQADKESAKAERSAKQEAYNQQRAEEKAAAKESRKNKSLSRRFFSWWSDLG
jgi:hypothetical protein